jgi:ABC-type molybdate transport system substrate-binding protein
MACTLLLCAAVPARAAEIKVLSGNGARHAIAELCAQFERTTGHTVTIRFEVNEVARALLHFLTGPAAAPVLRAAGVEPFVE